MSHLFTPHHTSSQILISKWNSSPPHFYRNSSPLISKEIPIHHSFRHSSLLPTSSPLITSAENIWTSPSSSRNRPLQCLQNSNYGWTTILKTHILVWRLLDTRIQQRSISWNMSLGYLGITYNLFFLGQSSLKVFREYIFLEPYHVEIEQMM